MPLVEGYETEMRRGMSELILPVERGWEVVFNVESRLDKYGHITVTVEIFANSMLLRTFPAPSLQEGIRIAELFARHVPRSWVRTGAAGLATAEISLLGADELLSSPPREREWHVPGMVPAGEPTLLSGDGGTGKSQLALQLGVSTVTGRPWLGRPIIQGPCIFLTAEDDDEEVHRRLDAIAHLEAVPPSDLSNLHIISRVGKDALLGILDPETRQVEPTALYYAVESAVSQVRPALLILDTLADLFGGDENDRRQARQFVGLLRRLTLPVGTTVLCLAHPSLTGINSGTGTSGSTGWSNSVRSRIYLERLLEWRGKGDQRRLIEPDPDRRQLSLKKANYGPLGQSLCLRWREGSFHKDDRLPNTPLPTAGKVGRQAEDTFLELLAAYEEEGRPVSANPSKNYAPSLFAKDERASGNTKVALEKAMNRLFAEKRLVVETYGPPTRTRSKIVASDATMQEATSNPPAN
jgi:RecA-family ATPase